MADTLEQRARFEAWWSAQPGSTPITTVEKAGGAKGVTRYMSPTTSLAWKAWQAREQAQQPKDHDVRELVNALRQVAVAHHSSESLRDRIAALVVPMFERKAQQPGAPAVASSKPWDIDALIAAVHEYEEMRAHGDADDIDDALMGVMLAMPDDTAPPPLPEGAQAVAWPSIETVCKAAMPEDDAFSAWRDAVPDKHWVRLDLTALRVGYELGKRVHPQPPSIPEPSEDDLEMAHGDFLTTRGMIRERLGEAIKRYTARLRERIVGMK